METVAPRTRRTPDPSRSSRSPLPPSLRAPVEGRTWRAFAHTVTSLPLAVVSFTVAVTMVTLGAGLAITFLGLPLLGAAFAAARGFGALERTRARALLDVEVEAPPVRRPRQPGLWGRLLGLFADGANWRALAYMVLLLPWAVFTFTVSVVFTAVGWSLLLYPAWQWVLPRFADQPGIQIWGNAAGDGWYLSSGLEIWGASAVGLLLVVASAGVVRGLAAVDTVMVRGLLGRGLGA